MAGPATLCRFDNRADRRAAWAIHRVMVERFIASYGEPPEERVLDFADLPSPKRSVGFAQAGRTSCHKWWPNQFRLLLAALAYTLVEAIRRRALHGAEMARAQVRTIRLTLLKIGAVILRNSRRVRFPLSSACPDQELFATAAARLRPG